MPNRVDRVPVTWEIDTKYKKSKLKRYKGGDKKNKAKIIR
jgi:hypothetical protein